MSLKLTALYIGAIFFLHACTDKSDESLKVIQELEKSINDANMSLNSQNEVIYSSFQEQLHDPVTRTKATMWDPKVQAIKKYCSEFVSHVETFKNDMVKMAQSRSADKVDSKNLDKETVTKYFKGDEKGAKFYSKMKDLNTNLLNIDAQMSLEFKGHPALTNLPSNSEQSYPAFAEKYLHHNSAITIAMLSELQNKMLNLENKLLAFCHESSSRAGCVPEFETYSAIIGQSSSYVRAREEISITAGVGCFSRAGNPTITINGKKITVEDDGAAHYVFKASSEPGKHFVPARIEYADREGKTVYIDKKIEYTVAKY